MNKVTKQLLYLLALSQVMPLQTDGEIVLMARFETLVKSMTPDKKLKLLLVYNAEQFRSVGDRSPKIPFTIPLVNCPVTGWEHDNGNVEASFRLWLETRDNGTVPNFP